MSEQVNSIDPIVQYYIVNSDLGMSTGKVAAQVAHVATLIALTWGNDPVFKEWLSMDQKKIVLKGKQKDLHKLIDQGFTYIIDNGLTEIPPGSLTVVGLPPMIKSQALPYVKRLQLL